MYKKTTLKNGLRLITVPIESANSVTVLILVGTGSKHETKDINGISHFLEHMFFKGTEKRPNTLNIAETLDRVGGEYNAFTSKEVTGFWAKVDKKHVDIALDWISDMFLHSKFDEIEIPFCCTIDFDTLENDTVTLRDRDTTKQERIKILEISTCIKKQL
ncbi:MAG: hypothetical protein A2416_04255 [Candidatus Staskawiczbacteria bacterium RIFOXYC1_FULL_37_52]|nr:MAG: hypothetical protein A2416_04255 [Candidatus Staskawiczbacteria bacterium RIFOXYC1_FULL_37_52]